MFQATRGEKDRPQQRLPPDQLRAVAQFQQRMAAAPGVRGGSSAAAAAPRRSPTASPPARRPTRHRPRPPAHRPAPARRQRPRCAPVPAGCWPAPERLARHERWHQGRRRHAETHGTDRADKTERARAARARAARSAPRPAAPAATAHAALSQSTIRRRRELRSAQSPKGIDSNRKGRVCAVASAPISPGPASSSSTATMGTAARLNCSADCAARLLATRALNDRGSGVARSHVARVGETGADLEPARGVTPAVFGRVPGPRACSVKPGV